MENFDFDYHFEGEENLDSPSLIYYEDIIEENIKKAVAMAGSGERLWPHVKTYKASALVKKLMAHGISRFKCATIAEAEMCAQCRAPDILVSYPLVGPAIDRFILLSCYYAASKFWAIGDDIEQLSILGSKATAANVNVPLLADVNSGMDRTGVSFDNLADFCTKAGKIPGLSLTGLHCYDGHLRIDDKIEREKAVSRETEKLLAIRDEIEAGGQKLPVLILGGSPTFPFHSQCKDAFLSPGTLFVHDYGDKSHFGDLSFNPGAAILTRVISRPAENLFTIDLGHKTISVDRPERGTIVDYAHAEPLRQSEEHWVFRMNEGQAPAIGTILYVIPAHICSTSALYPGVHVVRDRTLVNYWEITARDRRIAI